MSIKDYVKAVLKGKKIMPQDASLDISGVDLEKIKRISKEAKESFKKNRNNNPFKGF